jgi:hypothetical protein
MAESLDSLRVLIVTLGASGQRLESVIRLWIGIMLCAALIAVGNPRHSAAVTIPVVNQSSLTMSDDPFTATIWGGPYGPQLVVTGPVVAC